MLLRQVNIVGTRGLSDILIREDKIQAIYTGSEGDSVNEALSLTFPQAIAFPGLINSHDHLDFNLFPPLGNRTYPNYMEWARDIHSANKQAIDRVLRIPQSLRTQWGIYKNLINGATTVVNHGRYLPVDPGLITVFQGCRSLHSPAFEKNWRYKINFFFSRKQPLVMHLGEGTDKQASREIDRVIRWNFFKKRIIAVHGVAMNSKQSGAFTALVWCPASNYFLLNRTAAVNRLASGLPVMLGSDSTLTADWNLWTHLRMARKANLIPDELLWHMLGSIPAKTWQLGHTGSVTAGHKADLVIAAGKKDMPGLDRFYDLNPEDLLLVVHQGNIRLFDASLLQQLAGGRFPLNGFSRISVRGKLKYVEGNLPGLMQEIRRYHPEVSFPVSAS